MSQQIEEAVVRILQYPSGDTVGLGFFVNCEKVVTCTHVLNQTVAGTGYQIKPDNKVHVTLPGENDKWLDAQVLKEGFSPADEKDIAFLRLISPTPHSEKVDLDADRDCVGHDYEALTVDKSGTSVQRLPCGKILELKEKEDQQSKILRLSGGEVDVNICGAPVVDITTGHVVGMLSSVEFAENDQELYATPAIDLINALQQFPKMRNSNLRTWLWKGVSSMLPVLLLAGVMLLLVNTGLTVLSILFQLIPAITPLLSFFQDSVSPMWWLFAVSMTISCFLLNKFSEKKLSEKISKFGFLDLTASQLGIKVTMWVMLFAGILLTVIQNCRPPIIWFEVNDQKQESSYQPGAVRTISPQAQVTVRAYDRLNKTREIGCTWHVLDPRISQVISNGCMLFFSAPSAPTTTLISVETVKSYSINCYTRKIDYLIFQVMAESSGQ